MSMKKKQRHTTKQVAETKISETCDLKTLKFLFPNNWKEKLKELKQSKWSSEI